MSENTRKMDKRGLTRAELDQVMARAMRMRAEVTRDAFARAWGMVQRTITRRPTVRPARHA